METSYEIFGGSSNPVESSHAEDGTSIGESTATAGVVDLDFTTHWGVDGSDVAYHEADPGDVTPGEEAVLIAGPFGLVAVVKPTTTATDANTPASLADLAAATVPDASTTVKGATKLATAPASPSNPIAVGDNDSRLTNARTPTAHKTSHATGGSDALTAADIGADASGAASSAITAHIAASDPHGDRSYADSLFAANDALVYKGAIDASANPNYPAASAGHLYKISVAGKIGGGSGVNVEVGDSILCTVDGTLAGTQAAVGANWSIIQTNIDGAVIGPASATSGDLAVFSGTGGKLIAGSGMTPSNDDIVQRKSGLWVARSMAQVKTDLALVKADVGLGSVDNTADTAKPVSTLQQTALDLKANLASPAFTGNPTAPTPAATDADTSVATTAFVGARAPIWTPADNGLVAVTFDPRLSRTAVGGISSGWLVAERVRVGAPATVADLIWWISVLGATLSNCYAGLYSGSGTLIAKTADQSAVWTSTGRKVMALTAEAGQSLALTAGFYFVARLWNGTTQPQGYGPAPSDPTMVNDNLSGGVATLSCAVETGARTALPSTLPTMSSAASPQYMSLR